MTIKPPAKICLWKFCSVDTDTWETGCGVQLHTVFRPPYCPWCGGATVEFQQNQASMPKMRTAVQLDDLRRVCQDFISTIADPNSSENTITDCQNEISEVALTTIYGPSVWNWIEENE